MKAAVNKTAIQQAKGTYRWNPALVLLMFS
jgi:hypothetical protein